MNESGLIPCPACGTEIGTQAEICPKCGTPNTWKHPKIVEFEAQASNIEVARQFNYIAKGATIEGATSYHSYTDIAVITLIVLGTIYLSLGGGIFLSIFAGVGSVFYWRATTKSDTFKANLATKTWESTNESFWQPVRKLLEL